MNDRLAIRQALLDEKRRGLLALRRKFSGASTVRVLPSMNPDALLPAPAPGTQLRYPLTQTELKIWSRWHAGLSQRGVAVFKLRCGTGFFGLIQGGRANA